MRNSSPQKEERRVKQDGLQIPPRPSQDYQPFPAKGCGRTFAELAQAITKLHEQKNADYGNSFSILFQTRERARKGAGLDYAATRIFEKANRVVSLSLKEAQVKSEGVTDTLLDIAAYCLMTVEEMEK